jgi:hypothetical protein
VADICLANRVLASLCLAMDVYSVVESVTSGRCLPSCCLAVVICVTIWNTDGMTFGKREINTRTYLQITCSSAVRASQFVPRSGGIESRHPF